MEVDLLCRLRVELYADGASVAQIAELAKNPVIAGFTTNPTLMLKYGVVSYRDFVRDATEAAAGKPISFEVGGDEPGVMLDQAHLIAAWSPSRNVFVKIPVTNTRQEFTGSVIHALNETGINVNVTAAMTLDQVASVAATLTSQTPAIVSVFAGRIADTLCDPIPIMRRAVEILKPRPTVKLLWASPREVLNILHAEQSGCHIITLTSDVLAKLVHVGRDLSLFSLETVQMFRTDFVKAGYSITS